MNKTQLKNIFREYFKYVIILFFISVAIGFVLFVSRPPQDFPKKIDIYVKDGGNISTLSEELYNKKIIRSPFLLKVAVMVLGPKGKILSGEYRFEYPQNAFTIASRLSEGRYGFSKIKITISEGNNVSEVALIMLKNIPGFNASAFLALAKQYEGYLMPDTYYFYENVTPREALRVMLGNFEDKTKVLFDKYSLSEEGKKKVITIASLVEEEVNDMQDRRIVSGILMNRLEKNMPLQLDTTFWYLFNKGSLELTRKDLATDSPYNLYKYKGLPPTPITNPGLNTIKAVLNPLPTKYLFFLTGSDGVVHYAETYNEHLENRKKYIK
jgi:UPF0755 protein